jgi:hypothetical protein
MGAQAHFKHARAMGVGGYWTKIRRGVQKQKRTWSMVCGFASMVDHVKSRTCRSE